MTANLEEKVTLPVHEWLAIVAISLFLVTLTLFAYFGEVHPTLIDPPHQLTDTTIEIYIDGAVEKPGAYRIRKGGALKELIELAVPKESASMGRLNMKRKLRDGETIHISSTKIKKQPKRR